MWPQVSYGREDTRTQAETFQQQDQIDAGTFANFVESFASLDDLNELATFLDPSDAASTSGAASHSTEGLSAILDGTIANAHVKSLPLDDGGPQDVKAIGKARSELSEQLALLTKTDKLVDTLLSKPAATDGDSGGKGKLRKPNDRLERAVADFSSHKIRHKMLYIKRISFTSSRRTQKEVLRHPLILSRPQRAYNIR